MLSNDDINSPVKIIDFGLATTHSASDPPMTAFAGSAFTVAPEVVKRSYGKECDLWSVGVITYFLLTSRMPFNANSDKEIFQKILAGQYGYPAWTETGLSEEAKDFIDRLLVVDPKRRLTARQALSHLWIRKHNKNQLMTGSMNSHELMLVPAMETSIVPVASHGDGGMGGYRGQRKTPMAQRGGGGTRQSPPRREPATEQRQQRRVPPSRGGRAPARQKAPQQRPSATLDSAVAVRNNTRRNPRPSAGAGGGGRGRGGSGCMAPSREIRRQHEPVSREA